MSREVREIRCPVGPRRLFLKMLSEGGQPTTNPELNCMELSCQDCCRTLRREEQPVFRVLHRYAVNGELIETVVMWNDGTETINSEWS